MFLAKKILIFRTLVKTTNLSFVKHRELRQFVKSVQVLPPLEKKLNAENVVPQQLEPIPSPLSLVDPANPPEILPNFPPAFNFAAYVNKSESLQQLLKLGVDLSKIEKRKGLPQFVLKLDFEKDIQPHLLFLTDNGVPADLLGQIITKNPLIFKESLENLNVRINYLEAKRFKKEQIVRIITNNPFWLMFPTTRIDRRLGHFQQNFKLSGDDIRFLATKMPRLITFQMEHIKKNTFCIKEEMGFDEDEVKCLLLSKPKLWMLKADDLIERFDYVHRKMEIPHSQIIQFPEILTSREYRIRQRHEFLKYLGKAQYDPSQDLYVSLKTLVEGTDQEFVINVAKSTMDIYDTFLRTL